MLVYSGFQCFLICFTYSLTLLSPLCPHVPAPSVVIYVVKNSSRPVSGEDSPVSGGKRFVLLCGLYCNSGQVVMQVVSAWVAAQQLRRYRQRIVSRLRSLKAKLTFPQQLLHSRNLRGILRESILKYENVLIHERPLFTLALPEEILLHI